MTLHAYDQAMAAIRVAGHRPDQWQAVIELLALATRSRCGEMMGWLGVDRPPFRLLTEDGNSLDGMVDIWDEVGGHRPDVNPMIARGMHARPLETLVDTDLTSMEARRRHVLWNEVFDPYDIPHLGSVLLHRDPAGIHLVIGVLRTRAEGPLLGEERRLFDSLAQEASSAAAFTRDFGDESGKLVASAMDAMKVAAIALNGFGAIVGITPSAETMIAGGKCLKAVRRQIECADAEQRDAFNLIVQAGLTHGVPGQLVLRGGDQMLRVSLHRLDGELDLGYNARVILVLEDISEQLTLTAAEAEILELMRQGMRVNAIASRRGVSAATVRSQTKTIYSKLGAAGHIELLKRH